MPSIMTQEQLAAFNRDGFVIVPGMFDREEVELLQKAMELDPAVRDHMIDRADAKGAATRISLWNRAGDSVYGLAARCERSGLSLPVEAHRQGTAGRRRLGMAPGLRLLVL
jgi:ectoine hydroxylase